MADLLEASYTDPDFEDHNGSAFLKGQIDGEAMELARLSVMTILQMKAV